MLQAWHFRSNLVSRSYNAVQTCILQSEAFGLTHEMFIKMMSDSKSMRLIKDREEIAKQLSYFLLFLNRKFHILNAVLIAVLNL